MWHCRWRWCRDRVSTVALRRIPCVSESQPLCIFETTQKQDQGLHDAAMFHLGSIAGTFAGSRGDPRRDWLERRTRPASHHTSATSCSNTECSLRLVPRWRQISRMGSTTHLGMVYAAYLWWFWGWRIIVLPTWMKYRKNLMDPSIDSIIKNKPNILI